jgi:hypothetical protein
MSLGIPNELFTAKLSHPEFRLAVTMYHLSGPERLVKASMEELEGLTSMKREAVRRALQGLTESGLVAIVRTKRDFGKFHNNHYKLLSPCLENEVLGVSPCLENEEVAETPCLENEASTYGHVVPIGTSKPTSLVSIASDVKDTTYLLENASGVSLTQGVIMNMSERWKARGEDTSGDDSIGGFGLFEEELQNGQPKPKADKRKAATRSQRPEADWTTNDVATEFSFQMGRRFPYTPGIVKVSALRGALNAYRSKYGTTPEVEMELLRMFFGDERNLLNADEEAYKIHNRYLAMFKSKLNTAYERLGLEPNMRVLESALQAPEAEDDYLVASDGTEFDNSFLGRKRLASHEASIKETV